MEKMGQVGPSPTAHARAVNLGAGQVGPRLTWGKRPLLLRDQSVRDRQGERLFPAGQPRCLRPAEAPQRAADAIPQGAAIQPARTDESWPSWVRAPDGAGGPRGGCASPTSASPCAASSAEGSAAGRSATPGPLRSEAATRETQWSQSPSESVAEAAFTRGAPPEVRSQAARLLPAPEIARPIALAVAAAAQTAAPPSESG